MKKDIIGKEIYFNAGFVGLKGMLGGKIIHLTERYIQVLGVYSYPIYIDKKVLEHKDTKIITPTKKRKRKIYIKEIPIKYSCKKKRVEKELIISNLKLPPFK